MHEHTMLNDPVNETVQAPPLYARAVGIDLSLTATGWASLTDAGVRTGVVKSKPHEGLRGFIDRSHRIADELEAVAAITHDTLVVIEGTSLHSKSSSLDRIFGHWWMTVERLCLILDAEPVVVTPNQRAKYGTGKGNASKDAVMLATARRYPDVEISDNNTADAVLLLAMAARHLGEPLEESLPEAHLEPMTKVRWAA